MAIRDAHRGDAAGISRVQSRSWRVAYRGIAPDAFLDDLTDESWLPRWSQWLQRPPRPGAHRLVATDGGHIVSIAAAGPAIEPAGDATGELYLLYTDPDHWGQGHGGALLREVHERLADAGHPRALLWVAAENERSIAFYQHLGWELDGITRTEEVSGVTFDEARMVRELG